ncbi:PilW family protein [Oceanimonas marisflavi]|uniref:PilW family protein n=1 Tax=Oceanimonas marisflavi TaxID=2059724 RepID=UPI000D30AB89|nr:prepilin-type N-terminal cleavage/methylation domain-containing protein [Oceanimonas marisflavi]
MLASRLQQGMSLVEMLVSLVAGLIVVAGVTSLFASVIAAGNTTLMLSRLNQDVQGMADVMMRDIRRAGYHPSAAEDAQSGTPPSSAPSTAYVFSPSADLYASSGATAPDCIRVRYWDGEPVIRVYHYDAANEQLEYQESNSITASVATGSMASLCDSTTGWSRLISDQEVLIDHLGFALVSGSSTTGMRAIELAVSASHASRGGLSVSLQRQIKLRNDGY